MYLPFPCFRCQCGNFRVDYPSGQLNDVITTQIECQQYGYHSVDVNQYCGKDRETNFAMLVLSSQWSSQLLGMDGCSICYSHRFMILHWSNYRVTDRPTPEYDWSCVPETATFYRAFTCNVLECCIGDQRWIWLIIRSLSKGLWWMYKS